MGGNVLGNIWQLLPCLLFPPNKLILVIIMSTHLSAWVPKKEIISVRQDKKSQMQAIDVLHLYIKDNPLGDLTTLQLQNI